ncbi:glycosyltransferase family 2 protein [Agaribacterium sp. ZY112]|uniref:glycosyltransferase family 2 protein n=1 Tax=Agaribacterium sp. ZY112 TaxID=3233574 RepID=UPI0035248C7C
MKLKEYPSSLWRSWQLKRLPISSLLADHKEDDNEVIISLTSIPSRFGTIPLVLRSLLSQSTRPAKVVLCLHESAKSQIPKSLKQFESERFEIAYASWDSSHLKLVRTRELYPEATIVTCDDDLMYAEDWLQRLLDEHKQHPTEIIAHQARRVRYNADGELLPYKQWSSEVEGQSHDDTLALGYGGVLYPAHCLSEEFNDVELFSELTPKADDLWFKAMSFRQGSKVRRSAQPLPKPQPIAFSQRVALKKSNIRRDFNREQWLRLEQHFNFNFAPKG